MNRNETLGITFSIWLFIPLSCTNEVKFIYLEPVNQISACEVNDPLNGLPWLRSLVVESMDKPNSVERIWIKEYNEEDIIVIQYHTSSEIYYCHQCNGKQIRSNNLSIVRYLSDSDLIYQDSRSSKRITSGWERYSTPER